MAPVKATAVGILPQIVDDVELLNLLKELNSIQVKGGESDGSSTSSDEIARLVAVVARYPEWIFEEQVGGNVGMCDLAFTLRASGDRGVFVASLCYSL